MNAISKTARDGTCYYGARVGTWWWQVGCMVLDGTGPASEALSWSNGALLLCSCSNKPGRIYCPHVPPSTGYDDLQPPTMNCTLRLCVIASSVDHGSPTGTRIIRTTKNTRVATSLRSIRTRGVTTPSCETTGPRHKPYPPSCCCLPSRSGAWSTDPTS
jgi:hypothetical protein